MSPTRLVPIAFLFLTACAASRPPAPVPEPAAVVRRAVDEVFNQGQLEAAERHFAPEFAAEERLFAERIRRAFPDLVITLDRVVQEGPWVAVHWTATGTQRGEFAGIAPTGRRATWSGAWFWRVEGPRIVDGKALNVWDQFGLRAQLAGAGSVPR
jgi:predicted ester cyclase